MPLFYQNVSELLSLGSKTELDIFPRITGLPAFTYATPSDPNFRYYLGKYLKTKESEDCYEAFKESVWVAHLCLTKCLRKQNEILRYSDFMCLNLQKDLQQDYIRQQIFMSGIVQNESEIERVMDSADFKYFFKNSDLLKYYFELEAKISHDLRWKAYCYGCYKDMYKKRCLQCSGGPCLFGGDSGANDVNIGDGCMMYGSFIDKISVGMIERVEGHKRDFDAKYLRIRGSWDRHAIRGETFTSECHLNLPEVAEINLMESVHETLSQLSSRGKRWIEAELQKLTPRPRVLRTPAPLAQLASICGALLMGGFVAFGGYRPR